MSDLFVSLYATEDLVVDELAHGKFLIHPNGDPLVAVSLTPQQAGDLIVKLTQRIAEAALAETKPQLTLVPK